MRRGSRQGLALVGALGALVVPVAARGVTYVNEGFDSVTQPALPSGFSAQTGVGTATWQTVGTQYFSPSGAMFVPDPAVTSDARLTFPTIDVPAEAGLTGPASIDFLSRYEFELQADGGVAEISVDSGAFAPLPASDLTSGAYDGVLTPGTSNPIEGRPAWTGSSAGSWRYVRVALDRFAGHQIRLRLRMGSGSGGSAAGWWIDDVRALVPPAFGTPTTTAGSTWAVIDSPFDPRARPGLWSMEYGLAATYGSSAPAQGARWSGIRRVPTLLLGLTPETTYHYRGNLGFDDGGLVHDLDRSFATPAGVTGIGETFEGTSGSSLPIGWASFAPFDGGGWVTAPGGHTGSRALFLPNQATLVDTSVILPTVTVPANATSAMLSFWQQYDFEDPYDGGSLEVSTDGGAFRAVSLSDFDTGVPTKTIQSGNPLAGRRAWTGSSPGGWEAVRVDLTSSAGHNVTYRFRAGTDAFGARPDGWRIDDISLVVLAPNPPPVDPPPTTPPTAGPPLVAPPAGVTTPTASPTTSVRPLPSPDGVTGEGGSEATSASSSGSGATSQIRFGTLRIEVPRRLDRKRLARTHLVRVRLFATKPTSVVIRVAGGVRRLVVRPGGWRIADVRIPATLGAGRGQVAVSVTAAGGRRTVVVPVS